jgi:hypothetical protein
MARSIYADDNQPTKRNHSPTRSDTTVFSDASLNGRCDSLHVSPKVDSENILYSAFIPVVRVWRREAFANRHNIRQHDALWPCRNCQGTQ